LAYDAAQHVSKFREHEILIEENITIVARLLNEKKQFAWTKLVTEHNVKAFLEEERRKYHRICELAELPHVYGFSKRLNILLIRT
jgi:SUMO ligase MMS21 Smc5/6 complex component